MGYRKAPNPEGKTTVSHYSTLPRHSEASVSRIIDDVQPTSETLTGRAGLSLFVRYVRGIGLYPHLDRLFGSLRKSRKGQPVTEIFKQLLCFLLDGSSRHLVSFDALKEDAGYGGAIETKPEALLSSHAVKRFFGRFSMWRIWLFRRVLQQLFLWRLRLQQPPLILLGMDTMVMDNDEAPQRHGVAPTYKRVKGFQPLQVTWGRLLIDAVFRGGDKHSNHADTAQKTLSHLIQKIRRKYRSDVPIIVRLDSGFFDQKWGGGTWFGAFRPNLVPRSLVNIVGCSSRGRGNCGKLRATIELGQQARDTSFPSAVRRWKNNCEHLPVLLQNYLFFHGLHSAAVSAACL